LWHFWRLVRAEREDYDAHPAWIAMTLAGLAVPWAWALGHGLDPHVSTAIWPALWPLIVAAVVVWLKAWLAPGRGVRLPAGDLVVWLERVIEVAGRRLARLADAGPGGLPNLYPVHVRMTRLFLWTERKITSLPVAGVLILGLGGILWLVTQWI